MYFGSIFLRINLWLTKKFVMINHGRAYGSIHIFKGTQTEHILPVCQGLYCIVARIAVLARRKSVWIIATVSINPTDYMA